MGNYKRKEISIAKTEHTAALKETCVLCGRSFLSGRGLASCGGVCLLLCPPLDLREQTVDYSYKLSAWPLHISGFDIKYEYATHV